MKRILFVMVFFLSISLGLAGGVAGNWDFQAKSSSGEVYDLTLSLKEVGGKLTGELGTYDGSVPLDKVTLKEDKLTFDITTPEGVTYSSDLSVKGEALEGTYKGTDGSTGTITAKKKKSQ
jgi:hypothetical protein